MWWVVLLIASRDGVSIPDPRCFIAEASINIVTDAAGGGVPWGVPAMDRMMWTQHKWPVERAADALPKNHLERAWEDIGNVIEEWIQDPVTPGWARGDWRSSRGRRQT